MLQVILKVLTYEIQYHDHDLSIAALLRIVGGLLFFACIFPAYYSLSRPYRAKMDGRGIMGAIVGVMANVIQCLALHFFNTFLFLNQEVFFFLGPALPIFFNHPMIEGVEVERLKDIRLPSILNPGIIRLSALNHGNLRVALQCHHPPQEVRPY